MLTLKDAKIVQKWSALLPGCQGEGPGLLKSIQERLASYEAPGLSWKEESASTGFMKGLMGKRRDVLVVDVVGESVLVVRGKDAALAAFYDVCRHRGSQLARERIAPGRGSADGLQVVEPQRLTRRVRIDARRVGEVVREDSGRHALDRAHVLVDGAGGRDELPRVENGVHQAASHT